MNNVQGKRKIDGQTLYRNYVHRWIAMLVLMPVMLITAGSVIMTAAIFLTADTRVFPFSAISLLCLAIFGFGTWGLYQVAFQNRLVVTDQGIFYHYMHLEDFVRWDDMSHIEMRPCGVSTCASIVHHKPRESGRLDRVLLGNHFNSTIDLSVYMVMLARLDDYQYQFQDVEFQPLIQDIYRRAPHLFDALKDADDTEKLKREG